MPRATGTARFLAWMRALPPAAKAALQKEIEGQALQLVAQMKRAAPVRKGALRASIRAERTAGRQLSVKVKAGGPKTTRPVRKGQAPTYDYALGQEFGNVNARAQPFFFPSWRLRKPAVRRGLAKAVKGAVATAAKAT